MLVLFFVGKLAGRPNTKIMRYFAFSLVWMFMSSVICIWSIRLYPHNGLSISMGINWNSACSKMFESRFNLTTIKTTFQLINFIAGGRILFASFSARDFMRRAHFLYAIQSLPLLKKKYWLIFSKRNRMCLADSQFSLSNNAQLCFSWCPSNLPTYSHFSRILRTAHMVVCVCV